MYLSVSAHYPNPKEGKRTFSNGVPIIRKLYIKAIAICSMPTRRKEREVSLRKAFPNAPPPRKKEGKRTPENALFVLPPYICRILKPKASLKVILFEFLIES